MTEYVGIDWYVDDPEPRINFVVVFENKEKSDEWLAEAPSLREVREAQKHD